MPLNADIVLDRIQLKQKLRKWQLITLIVAVIALVTLVAPSASKQHGSIVKKEYVARVKLNGMLLDNEYRDKALQKLLEDKQAKAVIVSIDSPGGTTAAGETLYSQIRELSKSGKPVVVVMKTLAASGGYMAALGGDHIIARRGTLTGSIGVLVQSAEFTELAEKIGIKLDVLKTSDLKATPSPFEKLTPKAREAMDQVLDDFYQYFVDLVAERRKMSRDKALLLSDGRVYTGNQAVKNGLIDAIGGEKEALEWLRTNKEIGENLEVEDISTEKPREGLRELFFGDINESKIYKTLTTEGFLAIWSPQLAQ